MADSKDLQVRNLGSTVRGPFTMDFSAGSCAVIQGPSGIGKSLFLRMLADLDPNTGTVLLDGVDRATISAPRWRSMVTYVAAEPGFWTDILGEHMGDVARARQLFPDVALDPALLDEPVSRLSTGERQRAALVRAILGGPRFLLLDEPTSALDATSRTLVEALLARLRRDGMGLIVVSHDPAQANRIGDRHLEISLNGLTEVM